MASTTNSTTGTTYGSTSLSDLAPELSKRITDSLKEDPMAILPINLFCAALDIKDPLTVIKNFEPDKEDVGIMVNAVIGCVPIVGPILQGFFSLFWKRAAESNNVTKEELKKELDKLKKEMMEAVDGKIEKSEAKQWSNICDSFLKGLKKSFEVLTIHINAIKHQMSEKQSSDEQVQEAVRFDLELIRDKAMSLHEFCASDEFRGITLPYYIQSLQIYTVVMTIMDAFWYQIGIKPIFVAGKYATDKIGAVPSFRERMHNEIAASLTNIAKGIDKSKDKLDLDKITLLLKSDRYLYPVPLIEAPINIPNVVNRTCDVDSVSAPVITIPERDGPFIYRIDCINFRPDARSENIAGYRTMATVIEPVTGCKGNICGNSAALEVRLNTRKTVQVRVMGQYSDSIKQIPVTMTAMCNEMPDGTPTTFTAVEEEIGVTKPENEIENATYRSGLTNFPKMENVKEISFELTEFDEDTTVCRVLFIELIVQDNPKDLVDNLSYYSTENKSSLMRSWMTSQRKPL